MNENSRILLAILHKEMAEKRLEFDVGLALRTRVYAIDHPPTIEELEAVVRQFLPHGSGDRIIEQLGMYAGSKTA